MSKTVDPATLRAERKARRDREKQEKADLDVSGREGALPEEVVAQGRPQPMLRPEDLPDAVDAPDAEGPLSPDEQERWDLCRRGFLQYQQAWWVAAKALSIALRGRLWRRDHETAEDFIRDVAKMSTSNAYRQIAGAQVAEALATVPILEQDSNDLSRMRDSTPLVISQRAAESLTAVREDYGADAAAVTYRTVAEVTGQDTVSQRTIRGVVQQLPRKAEEELGQEELVDRVRSLAEEEVARRDAARKAAAEAVDPIAEFRAYVHAAREFAGRTRGMAGAYRRAAAANPKRAAALAERLHGHMGRATQNFPDV